MSWKGWKRESDAWINTKQEGDGWVHMLVANLDTTSDAERDRNHIHFKWGNGFQSVLCSVKEDGIRRINRRELIKVINRICPNLNLSHL